MPLLTITLKEEDLQKKTIVLLERPYVFTHLKLLHIYHNIDATNFTNSRDKAQQVQLFIRLGGLVENSHQIINYVGDYDSYKVQFEDRHYNSTGIQNNNLILVNDTTAGETVAANSVTKRHANVDVNHLIPIGASKHNSAELISRDLFKELHKEGVLTFNGELEFELFYLDKSGSIAPVTSTTGGIVIDSSGANNVGHVSYLTLMFEYEEK